MEKGPWGRNDHLACRRKETNPVLLSSNLQRFLGSAFAEAQPRSHVEAVQGASLQNTPAVSSSIQRSTGSPSRSAAPRIHPDTHKVLQEAPTKPPPRGGGGDGCKSRHRGFWRHPSYKSSLVHRVGQVIPDF